MPTIVRSKSRRKVQAHRDRLRKQGLRPVQLWVPDVRTKRFRQQAHSDALAIANSRHEKDDQAFVDSISLWPDHE